jgi:uncharacterized protein (TIGR03437 family)
VRLFRQRDQIDPAPGSQSPTCIVGTFYSFESAEVSADGRTIAAGGRLSHAGYCNGYLLGTDLIAPGGDRDLAGHVRLSPGGRYAIADTTSGPFTSATLAFLDLQTGSQTPIQLPSALGPYQATFPGGGRTIADDGTAVFSYFNSSYIARPGQPLAPFPVPNAQPIAIDASGTKVLYGVDGTVRLLDLGNQQDQLVLADSVGVAGMSDDATRVLFLRGGQYFVIQTDGTGMRALPGASTGIANAILSGNGKVVYEAAGGRLLKIAADTGDQVEIIGRTPYITQSGGYANAGTASLVAGGGFAEQSSAANPPFPQSLGNVSVRIGGRPAPVTQVTPTSVGFLVPWDAVAPGAPVQADIVVEANGVHSPFDFPVSQIQVNNTPLAGPIVHQNWDGAVTIANPPYAGEIVHVYAVGLGPVSPDVPEGAAAPAAEPLARLATPMTCANATVLYAGLAPGAVERIYQVDLRLDADGYRQFHCSLASVSDFIFLTLLVLPQPAVPPTSESRSH